MLSIHSRQGGQMVPLSDFAEAVENPVIWIDLLSPTPEEVKRLESYLGIALPTRDEMAEIELSDRLYNEDGAEFMTMTVVANVDTDEPVKAPVTFIIKGPTLVTMRHIELRPFSNYSAKALRGGVPCASGESVMLGLIEALIDRIADTLERTGDEVDAISREVFRGKSDKVSKKTRNLQSLIEQIGNRGDLLTKLRESLVSISRLVAYHTAIETNIRALDATRRKSPRDIRQRTKLIQRDSAALGEHAIFLAGKINFLLDATLGLINLEQNQIIKIFSVAAVVFLPPTLVASIYGMNFEFMPELDWAAGYPWALGLMLVSAIIPYLYFNYRGWL